MSELKEKSIFGTDGIRGMVNQYPITSEIALKIGLAIGSYINSAKTGKKVIIAKDTRLSGYMIEPALTSGLISLGIDVILVGPMPTPSVPMLIKSLRADFGIMITASHNPGHDNGMKIFDNNGRKLDKATQEIIENRVWQNQFTDELAEPNNLGRASRLEDVQGRYIEHIKRSVPKNTSFKGLKVVVDCANGSAYKIAPTVFWELGAEIIKVGCEPNGLNINDKCGSTKPETFCQKVRETKADIGIALDGDADRVVICDEKGELITGDSLMALIINHLHKTKQLQGNGVAITKVSNSALVEFCHKLGLQTFITDVGDKNVYAAMAEHELEFGGEESGHLIFSEFSNTGDGIVSALQILSILKIKQEPLSKLRHLIELYPQQKLNIPFSGDNPLPKVQKEINALINRNQDMKITVRKSGTEPLIRIVVEGQDTDRISKTLQEIKQIIQIK
jgi:phosphoglucosamine mutase